METSGKKMTWNKILYSSSSGEWITPDWLFNALNNEFNFDLDAAASPGTEKCGVYLSPNNNALVWPDWRIAPSIFGFTRLLKTAFLNCPYNRGVHKWIEKAYQESRKGMMVVCLLMARTDTQWWHDYVMKADEVRFIKGRVKFIDPNTREERHPATAPSVVIIFRPHWDGPPRFSTMVQTR